MQKTTKTRLLILFYLTAVLSLTCNKQLNPAPDPTSASPPAISEQASRLMAVTSSVSLTDPQRFTLGINGHMGDAPYLKTAASKQMDMLRSMDMKWYRLNIQTKDDGSMSSDIRFKELSKAAEEKGINILPMLYTRTLELTDIEATAYQLGKKLGSNFAAKYGRYFTYYDLGNDLELPLLLKGKTGQSQNHYDRRKTNVTAAYLKGMDEGIKQNDPDAKTMISSGWLHYAFIKMCESYGVKFDVVAYHWYSDMEKSAPNAPYNIPDITIKLSTLFPKKSIWFTEYNYRYKEIQKSTYETDQNLAVTKFITKCKANPQVKVLVIYELFNEPYKKTEEANFGIIKWVTPYTVWAKKIIANTLTLK
jgi:hypothetical protein